MLWQVAFGELNLSFIRCRRGSWWLWYIFGKQPDFKVKFSKGVIKIYSLERMCSSWKLNDLQRATGVLQKCYRLPLHGTRENVHYTGGGLPLYSAPAHSLSFQVKEEEEERVLDNCQRSLPPICIPPTSPSPHTSPTPMTLSLSPVSLISNFHEIQDETLPL